MIKREIFAAAQSLLMEALRGPVVPQDDGTIGFTITRLRAGHNMTLTFSAQLSEKDGPSVVQLFHRDRGCCDGSDIDACTKARAAAEAERERAAKGKSREEGNDYEGTNPSNGVFYFDHRHQCIDGIECPLARHHGGLKMGQSCKTCGFVA